MKKCFKGYSEALGNKTGSCCCNCSYQAELRQRCGTHVADQPRYACTVFFVHPSDRIGGVQKPGPAGIVTESNKHGMCEMWDSRDGSELEPIDPGLEQIEE